MNQKQIEIIKQQLHISGERVTTTSMAVAEGFGKEHFHVLRDIEDLDCSPEFRASNFGCVTYTDKKGEKRPAYEMTRNGFMFLAMGYTGPLAAFLKELYITAFDQMERELQQKALAGRADVVIGTLAIAAAIARAGHKADFLARLVHLRFAGLTVKEVGRVLGVSKDSVVRWSSVLRKAGVEFPKSANPATALLNSTARQLALPGVER